MTINPTTPITDAMHVKREIEMYRRAQEDMKKCVNCKRFEPISYVGGDNIYSYCDQGDTYEPCSGGECDYPDYYEPKKRVI